jgi:phosphate transport system substrate-binding protein
MRGKLILVFFVLLLLAVSFFIYGRGGKTQESIKVSGAWALYPMMVKWGEEYQKINPNVKIDISAGGAGKGMADTLGGLVDIGMVSRDIDPSEVNKGAFPLRVVKDAVIPAMNKDNPLAADILRQGVKKQQFKDIFISGNLTSWGEVIGKQGSKDKIAVYVRSDSCGAAEIWAKYLGVKQEDLKGIGIYGDPGIAEAVSKDVRGIGFNNLNFAYDSKTGLPSGNLMMIPIDLNENGRIDETENFYSKMQDMIAAISDGRYPSPPARELFIVTKGKPSGASKDFVNWILEDGQKYVVDTGYIPLEGSILEGEIKKLD